MLVHRATVAVAWARPGVAASLLDAWPSALVTCISHECPPRMYLPRRLSRSVVQRANLVCLVIAVLVMCRVTHGGPVPDTLPGPVLSPEPARFHDDHTFFHRPGHLRYNPRRRRDSNETSTKRSVRNAHDEPKFLTSKTGYTLVVTQDGTVRGVRQVRPKDGR